MANGLGILGGSFNPPHIGHLRLALELSEIFADKLGQIVLVPCAHPPHKAVRSLLPFTLRCAMLKCCINNLPKIGLSQLEGERQGPSYTFETLAACQKLFPNQQLYFILGSDDYAQLATWYQGLDLPKLCHLIVVPRGAYGLADFWRTTTNLWPSAEKHEKDLACGLPFGGQSFFAPIKWLDISATEIRQRWCRGQSLDFLVPSCVLELLTAQKSSVQKAWQGC
ncbi:MAG: nicotinate (nicotinamide) nucleotide adenylyltransferase [Desulfovibrionaceae bacterium]|nr:nicotinate (nicotinamide) nucleotide adenylyltransferase [Desulfovibrionaceae bacterium]